MSAASRIAEYGAVVRKHVVLLAASVAVVLATGAFYLWRQPAVYEAEALLLVEQPMPNLMGSGPARNYFAIGQAALNTELYLLREDTALARGAIDDVRGRGVDPDSAGYSPESLAASVTVSQVPGTEGLVRFALTGRDPDSLPAMVDCYADAYIQQAVRARSEPFELQLADLRARVEAARRELEAAETSRDDFAKQHAELNLARGENPHATRRGALARQIPALEQQALADAQTLRRVREALESAGVAIVYEDGGDSARLTGIEPPRELHLALARGALVAGLPAVRDHPEISRLRTVEAEAESRDRELARQGFSEEHEQRREVARELTRTEERRGWITARAVEFALTEIAARTAHLERVRADLDAAAEAEERLNRILGDYQERQRVVTARERSFEEARSKLSDFTGMYLTAGPGTSGAEGEQAREPRLRISVRVPPRAARQVAPRTPLVIGLTVVAALATGLGLVFLFEYLDDTIRSKDDFDRYVGLPFLGFVPRLPGEADGGTELAADAAPGSAAAEAFRAVRTSILFARGDHPVRTMLITSAGPGEGKTTIATNLAATFARRKGPVLLVDADLRKPRVAAALGVEDGPGLSNVLVGEVTLADVARTTAVEGLEVVTSGPIPPNPAELLHGECMAQFLDEAAERYSTVVIDTPPLVAVSDARVLAGRVDGLYLVISLGRTSRRLIQRGLESLATIGFPADGAVLNNVSAAEGRYSDYGGYYGGSYGQGYRRRDGGAGGGGAPPGGVGGRG